MVERAVTSQCVTRAVLSASIRKAASARDGVRGQLGRRRSYIPYQRRVQHSVRAAFARLQCISRPIVVVRFVVNLDRWQRPKACEWNAHFP